MRRIIYTSIFVLGMYANVYTAPDMESDFSGTKAGQSVVTVHSATSEAIRIAAQNAIEDILLCNAAAPRLKN